MQAELRAAMTGATYHLLLFARHIAETICRRLGDITAPEHLAPTFIGIDAPAKTCHCRRARCCHIHLSDSAIFSYMPMLDYMPSTCHDFAAMRKRATAQDAIIDAFSALDILPRARALL